MFIIPAVLYIILLKFVVSRTYGKSKYRCFNLYRGGFESNQDNEYYDILGIKRTATEREIKKAYRDKAMRTHPDKGGDTEEFKKLAEAYEILSDPEKKSLYDKFGKVNSNDKNGGNNPFSDLNSFFRGFGNTGGGGAFGFSGRGFPGFSIPIIYRLDMHLEDLYNGKKLNIPVQIGVNQERIDITIEPGMATGYELLVRNVGGNGYAGGGRDLVFRINELKHSHFIRNNNDLLMDVNITLQEALFGFFRSVKHLNGRNVWFQSPKNEVIQADDVFMIEGEGMPIYSRDHEDMYSGHRKKGNLFIRIRLSMPKYFTTCNASYENSSQSVNSDDATLHKRRLLNRFREDYCELTGEFPLYSSEIDEFDLSPVKLSVTTPTIAKDIMSSDSNKERNQKNNKTWIPGKRATSAGYSRVDVSNLSNIVALTNESSSIHLVESESFDLNRRSFRRLIKPKSEDSKAKIVLLKRSDLKNFGTVGAKSSRSTAGGDGVYSNRFSGEDDDDMDYEESFQRFFFR